MTNKIKSISDVHKDYLLYSALITFSEWKEQAIKEFGASLVDEYLKAKRGLK